MVFQNELACRRASLISAFASEESFESNHFKWDTKSEIIKSSAKDVFDFSSFLNTNLKKESYDSFPTIEWESDDDSEEESIDSSCTDSTLTHACPMNESEVENHYILQKSSLLLTSCGRKHFFSSSFFNQRENLVSSPVPILYGRATETLDGQLPLPQSKSKKCIQSKNQQISINESCLSSWGQFVSPDTMDVAVS